MDKMATYMFGALDTMGCAINNINNTLAKQAKINSKFKWFMVTTSLYIWMNEKAYRMQQRKITDLEKEIKELKETKGE